MLGLRQIRSLLNSSFTITPCCLTRVRIRLLLVFQLFLLCLLTVITVLCIHHLRLLRSTGAHLYLGNPLYDPSVKIFPKTQEEAMEYKKGFNDYAFNVFVSDRMSLRRSVPDTRDPQCAHQAYYHNTAPFSNLSASVVIIFHNEARSILRRTLNSIIDRTDDHLLREILLINDGSTNGLIADDVTYISKKIVYRDAPYKMGLIKGRNFGAALARGRVLVFLDSHVEVNTGWLEPLLSFLVDHPNAVVLPMVDVIDEKTLTYYATPPVIGGFNWEMNFEWNQLPEGTPLHKPFPSPIMSGGLLAMRLSAFIYFGRYDNLMETWGGENLEMSFRIWQCHGAIFVQPCSRIGHIFRARRPYGEFTGRVGWLFNSARAAAVWMGPFKQLFLEKNSDAKSLDLGDLSERLALRSKLKCNSFGWFLRNVANPSMSESFPLQYKAYLSDDTFDAPTIGSEMLDKILS